MTKDELRNVTPAQRDKLFFEATNYLNSINYDFSNDEELIELTKNIVKSHKKSDFQNNEAYLELDLYLINKADELRMIPLAAA